MITLFQKHTYHKSLKPHRTISLKEDTIKQTYSDNIKSKKYVLYQIIYFKNRSPAISVCSLKRQLIYVRRLTNHSVTKINKFHTKNSFPAIKKSP